MSSSVHELRSHHNRDIKSGMSQRSTGVTATPTQKSPTSTSSFNSFFQSLSCCVSSRKLSPIQTREGEKPIGTGARSRIRRVHKPRHFTHGNFHSHAGSIRATDNESATPVMSSTATSAASRSSPILENWMESFAEWRLVDIPIIPGTHHSGVNNPRKRTSQPVWGWAKCQDIGIEEQLHYGVRFFDLRVRIIPKTEEVLISHGLTSDTSLAEAIEVISTYLQEHESEGVVMYIRADRWHGVDKDSADLLAKIIKTTGMPLVKDPILANLRVKDIAGKALLISTPETLSPQSGIPFLTNDKLQYCDIWQESTLDGAKSKIEAYMLKKPERGDVFGGVAIDGTFPIRQQSQTSRELNTWFVDMLSSDDAWKDRIELHQFGIVMIDFADFDLLNFLIGINNKLINIRNST